MSENNKKVKPTRPETGPMQFGEDWPGVFIRGDHAMHYASHLRMLLDGTIKPEEVKNFSNAVGLHGLLDLLTSCYAHGDLSDLQLIKEYKDVCDE